MRSNQSYRRRSSASFWLGMALILILGFGGVAGVLFLFGVNLNPFSTPKDDPFVVLIPINSQPIPAFEPVTREHLLNPRTRAVSFQRVPPQATVGMSITGVTDDGTHVESLVAEVRNVEDEVVFVTQDGNEVRQGKTLDLGGAILNVGAIIGRVVKKDKREGLGFQESTFFPLGTPAGLAGATPPGMRAMTLDATKIKGVHALNSGDRIDLMTSVPVGGAISPSSGPNASSAILGGSGRQDSVASTEPLLLAESALVLKPVYVRNEATTSSSLTQGKMVQNVPKYEVAIAVESSDVIPLQNALDKELNITCIAHSMRVEDDLENSQVSEDDVDTIKVPVTVRPILAYSVVTRQSFVNPATRRIQMTTVSREEADRQGLITRLEEAVGAVAKHDIPGGRYLRKADLLTDSIRSPAERRSASREDDSVTQSSEVPVQWVTYQEPVQDNSATAIGDRPAITRFVPAGYTAFAVPWNRLYGAEHLQIGDELDLLASYSLENTDEEEEVETRPDGTTITRKRNAVTTRETLRTWDESLGMRGEPWFVATDAIVVGPVGFPAPASATRALGNVADRQRDNSSSGNRFSGPALVIAIDDRDVETLATALATKDALLTPAFRPSTELAETPQGTKRIAIAAQDVAAYQQLTETVWNGNRRRPLSRWVSAADPRFEKALTIDQIEEFEFRVLKRAKRSGEFFVADDFMPVGTTPGVASAAGPNETVFAIADREIEGLDTFRAEDQIMILFRAVLEAPQGVVTHGLNLKRPVSSVVVPSARIVRSSEGGQTILAVANEDLTRLQAAWAASLTENKENRSHLLAVALPRAQSSTGRLEVRDQGSKDEGVVNFSELTSTPAEGVNGTATPAPQAGPDVPAFDGIGGVKMIEAIVGDRREYHAFPEDGADASGNRSNGMNFTRADQ